MVTQLTVGPKGNYQLRRKVPFGSSPCRGDFTAEEVARALEFGFDMAYGSGEHRPNRTRGSQRRGRNLIFRDTVQGKLGELAVHATLKAGGIDAALDFDAYARGTWDSGDFLVAGKSIQVKSAKHFSDLLLLECADWTWPNVYIHGANGEAVTVFAVVFVRVKMPDFAFATSAISTAAAIEHYRAGTWSWDIPGVAGPALLDQFLRPENILPRGAVLGQGTPIDVDNFYVQSYELRPFSDLTQILQKSLLTTNEKS